MPVKMIVMVKRRPDLSPAEFRAGYEGSHSRIAVNLFGHLWQAYRRNYLVVGRTFAHGNVPGVFGPDEIGLDAISEFILPDMEALTEMGRIAQENFELIKADEARWFDAAHSWVIQSDTVEEDFGRAGNGQNAGCRSGD